ncbi:MAG TPA: glucose-6-phosphate isomerase [Clostridia bacterium]|nr:glucose-6-phosphate isomerase [Clostridia bacterium]
MLRFGDHLTDSFVHDHERQQMIPQLLLARDLLDQKKGPGSEYTGWLDLPVSTREEDLLAIEGVASDIRENFDILIVVGIGGSYLGARALIEALSHHFAAHLPREKRKGPLVFFAGHQISPDYMHDLIQVTRGKRVALNVISKSGTTTEPALAFRILRQQLFADLSDDELRKRVFITTDRSKGALRQFAREAGLTSFDISDDIGGRYSVLTPVGLLPIAVAGVDIRALMAGARTQRSQCLLPLAEGWAPADRYAVNRMIFLRKGYKAEMLASYEPSMHFVTEWWKQLFGESEGKDGRGLIPVGADFTTDLHSLGQLIQEGPRILFETVIRFENTHHDVIIPPDSRDIDQLEYLAGLGMAEVNDRAVLGTALAHTSGGVPNMEIVLEERCAFCLGELIYFFERACALASIMNGVNPFDQPGVEAYKRNMFALLGKPGFESLRAELTDRPRSS